MSEVDRRIVADDICQQTREEPATFGSIEDGLVCG
jgi:hypothetical protein